LKASFFKNEATDLLDNKASASSRIRNEATLESKKQMAKDEKKGTPQQAAERRKNLAHGETPGLAGRRFTYFFCRRPDAEGKKAGR